VGVSLNNQDKIPVLKIVAIYAVVGGAWIYFSDTFLGWLVQDPAIMVYVAISKGFLFIITTTLLLYVLIRRYADRILKINRMLKEKEELLRSVASNTPGVIYQFYATDAGEFGISYINEKVADIFGLNTSLEDFFLTFTSHVMAEDRNRFMESIRNAVAGCKPWSFEGRFIRPDGEMLWFHGRSTPIREEGRLLFDGVLLDITEKKATEEKIRRSEAMYRRIADNMSDVVSEVDAKGNYIYVGPSHRKIFGREAESLIGISVFDYVHPEDRDDVQKEFLEGVQTGTDREVEYRFRHENGHYVWVRSSGRFLFNEKHEFTGIVICSSDISARKRAEQALGESENRFRSIMEQSPFSMIVFDLSGNAVHVNEAHLRLWGVTQEMVKRYNVFNDPQMEALGLLPVFRRAFAGEQIVVPPMEYDLTATFGAGHKKTVQGEFYPLRDEKGDVFLLILIHEDVTEQMMSEKALKDVAREWQTTFDAVGSAVWLLDANQRIVRVNRATARLFGKDAGDVIGHFCWEIVHETSCAFPACPVRKMQTSLRRESMELQVGHRCFEIVADPILNDDNSLQGIVHIITDITERKIAEEEKKKLEVQLTQAQKMESIGTLAGGIAHDFNNILSAIIGYSELARMDLPESGQAAKNLDQVLTAAGRARSLVSQILTFSRKKETSYLPLELPLLINESLKMLRSVIPATIDIRQDLVPSAIIMSDPTQIQQMMMNLCVNASHAMDEKGGALTVSLQRVVIDATAAMELDALPGPYLKLAVSDTGCGMAPDVRERIFEPYFTTKETGRGTGLGLSVVHGIVKSHKGAIVCRSRIGEGTTFEIYLPEIVREKVAVESREQEPLPMGTEKILVVDDEKTLTDMIEHMLQILGYHVVTRSSSPDALELFRRNPDRFDLIISDMTMPEMNGDKLARKILDIRRNIPIILCTGYNEHISEEKAKEMGIRDLIMKPFAMEELARTIRRVLDEKESFAAGTPGASFGRFKDQGKRS